MLELKNVSEFPLKMSHFRVLTLTIFTLLAILWWTAADISREASRRRYEKSLLADIIPKEPITLSGSIRIVGFVQDKEPVDDQDRDERGRVREYRHGCNALCAALLATPGVTSVTVAELGDDLETPILKGNSRFRIVPRDQCQKPSVIPQSPDSMRAPRNREVFDDGVAALESNEQGIINARLLETQWRIRLSSTDCIVADRDDTVSDFTILHTSPVKFGPRSQGWDWKWTREPLNVLTQRLEILGRDGQVHFRRSFTSTKMLVKPLLPSILGEQGAGIPMPVFGWARTTLSNFKAGEEFDFNLMLRTHTNVTEGLRTNTMTSSIAGQLRRAIDDPNLPDSDPIFALSETWMRSLSKEAIKQDDQKLLIALIKDRRVKNFLGMWNAVAALPDAGAILRSPILARIEADYSNAEAIKPLAAQLARLPKGDKDDHAHELYILNDPEMRLYAGGLIIHQSEYGSAAVPLLLKIIREHATRSMAARQAQPNEHIAYEIGPIDAAQVALCRIGPDAKQAIAELQNMTAQGLFLPSTLNDRSWKFMLARVGTEISDIKKPSGLNTSQKQYSQQLRDSLAAFDATRDCREAFT